MFDAASLRQHLMQMPLIEGRAVLIMDQAESSSPQPFVFPCIGIVVSGHDATRQHTLYNTSIEDC